jgi:heme/copper-type cytochrome/quinol oxidase subunit 3
VTGDALGGTDAGVKVPDNQRLHAGDHHPENGTPLGFWFYLLSDRLILWCLAVYAVVGRSWRMAHPAQTCSACHWWQPPPSVLLLSSIMVCHAGDAAPPRQTGAGLAGGHRRVGLHLHRYHDV